jgi:hypothetical protein
MKGICEANSKLYNFLFFHFSEKIKVISVDRKIEDFAIPLNKKIKSRFVEWDYDTNNFYKDKN